MLDISYTLANRHGKTFTIVGRTGEWELLRVEGDTRSKRYVFRRPSKKSPNKWTEIKLSSNQMNNNVYENYA